ncbi:DUF6397 family protein [Streptomyces sp. NPDC002054]|uniref:DUF6397 family protein n=1 Tax=Streptomyces sp. NPDC002054 TaxID=3154663 RepID=UPI00331C3F1C
MQTSADTMMGGARAAGELGLRRGEFAWAVQLGIVRAGPPGPAGTNRFTRKELDRIRAGQGFPEALREQIRTLTAAGAAELLAVSPGRFTRLARCGHVTPVGYRINRYRAVVWLYLADDLKEFAARRPDLLRGAAPDEDRERLAAREDQRPRRWRGRHVGLLLRRTADPWERAAVLASVLPGEQLDEAVPDPAERTRLAGLAPPPPHGHPHHPAAVAVAQRLLRAEQEEEILWYRTSLDFALTGARAQSKTTGERGPT